MDGMIPVPTMPAPHPKPLEGSRPATLIQSGKPKAKKERNVRFTKEEDADIIDALTSKMDRKTLRNLKEKSDTENSNALILEDLETLCRVKSNTANTGRNNVCCSKSQKAPENWPDSSSIDGSREAHPSNASQDAYKSQENTNIDTNEPWISKDEESLYKEAAESDAVIVDSFDDDPDEVFQLIDESDCEEGRQIDKVKAQDKSRKGYENALDDVSWQVVGYTGL